MNIVPQNGGGVVQGAAASNVGLSSVGAAARVVFRAPVGDKLAAGVGNTPANNMGCFNTPFFDWISFTVIMDSLPTVVHWLTPSSASVDDWVGLHHGGMGYRACLQRGHMRVYYDGADGMGVHVALSGQAVRQLEQEFGLFTEDSWQAWLSRMVERGCRFTRVDAAMDDRGDDAVLDMRVIEVAARERHLVSPFHYCERRTRDMWELGEGGATETGETLYFGRRSSDMFVRIYNKAAQQGEAFHHIRVEMECKKRNAEQLVAAVITGGFGIIPRLLRGYLDFKQPPVGSDTNKSRWDTVAWWDVFLDRCEKARFLVKRIAGRSLDTVKEWFNRQAAPLLAVLMDAIEKECLVAGLDVRKMQRRYLYGQVEQGRSRYKTKHRVLLSAYVPSLGGGLSW
jgi:phage replication initiation protein